MREEIILYDLRTKLLDSVTNNFTCFDPDALDLNVSFCFSSGATALPLAMTYTAYESAPLCRDIARCKYFCRVVN